MAYEPLREYQFWAQGFEHNSDAPNEFTQNPW